MEEMGRKLKDVALVGSWASGWKELTFREASWAAPALSICARKGSRVGAFGWRVTG